MSHANKKLPTLIKSPAQAQNNSKTLQIANVATAIAMFACISLKLSLNIKCADE